MWALCGTGSWPGSITGEKDKVFEGRNKGSIIMSSMVGEKVKKRVRSS